MTRDGLNSVHGRDIEIEDNGIMTVIGGGGTIWACPHSDKNKAI